MAFCCRSARGGRSVSFAGTYKLDADYTLKIDGVCKLLNGHITSLIDCQNDVVYEALSDLVDGYIVASDDDHIVYILPNVSDTDDHTVEKFCNTCDIYYTIVWDIKHNPGVTNLKDIASYMQSKGAIWMITTYCRESVCQEPNCGYHIIDNIRLYDSAYALVDNKLSKDALEHYLGFDRCTFQFDNIDNISLYTGDAVNVMKICKFNHPDYGRVISLSFVFNMTRPYDP